MKFKTTDTLNLRVGPSTTSAVMGKIPAGTTVESDQHMWKFVTLPDGRKGYCAATYLEEVASVWHPPIRADKFNLTQQFLEPDAVTYPKTGHHPGVDFGTQGDLSVPTFFCADGEVIESGVHTQFGNYFFYYVPEVDRTFVYFHLRDKAPLKGKYTAGTQCGVAGSTGKSFGAHLHLECLKGKKTSSDRSMLYSSLEALKAAAEDAGAYIRARL